jgi:hypothetical protein
MNKTRLDVVYWRHRKIPMPKKCTLDRSLQWIKKHEYGKYFGNHDYGESMSLGLLEAAKENNQSYSDFGALSK